MKVFLNTVFCALVFAAAIFSQTPSPMPTPKDDDDVVKISTTLIQTDVTVTDKKGKLVTDLKPEDFEIYENGELQKITNFSFVSAPTEIPTPTVKNQNTINTPPTVPIKPEQVRRTIALVIDDLTLSFESSYYVQKSLKKFINEQMQDGDLVAIIRTGSGIGALQQFTSDKRQLLAAAEKVRWNPNGSGKIGTFAPIRSGLGNENASSEESDEPTRDSEKEFEEFRESIFATGTLGALDYIVRGMRELPGRKSVMLFSDGLRIMSRASGFTENNRILNSVRRLIDLANRASVVVYTMDARGLQTLGFTAEDDLGGLTSPQQFEQQLSNRRAEFFDTQEGLTFLARETGGFAIVNNNDLNRGISRVMEDQKGYYLIGYQPEGDTFDAVKRRFNKLVVKVKNPDLRVRYRSGFFGVTDEQTRSANQTPYQAIMSALTSPFAANAITVRINSLFGNNPKDGSFVRSFLHIDAKDLKFNKQADGNYQSVFDIVAITFGDNGTVVDQNSKTYTFTVKEEALYRKIMEKGFVYQVAFPVKKAGAYQLRIAIRDKDSGTVGSANQFIEVPDLKKERLTLSGIILENLTFAEWEKLQNPNTQNYRQEIAANPLNDTSLRRFRQGTVLRFGFEIYNAKTDAAKNSQLTSQIRLFRDGKPFFEGKINPVSIAEQPDLQRIKVNQAMTLGKTLEPGEYILQMVITDNLAKEKRKVATQFVTFEVVK